MKSLGATGIPYQYPSPHSHTPYLYPYPHSYQYPYHLYLLLITIHLYPLLITITPTTHHPLSPTTLYLVPFTSYHFRQSVTGISRVFIPHTPHSYHSLLISLTLIHSPLIHYSYPLPSHPSFTHTTYLIPLPFSTTHHYSFIHHYSYHSLT